ncbi:hypothetical protein A2483_04635 [Candidatus Peregrinibacteria bacterium RIFOXYC2_FULL_33_13]|nr:MAG: capsular polysaccharide biosynthsis protein M [Candidatus Peregrinibacteria bacterium GW2011_GWC2_33_13]OGJ56981.1 MAG: hypothetical protein A2483_04635 [Candidatus Peregrinibacteria bacterium RIFOXYC2_FULL_33_13]
MKILMFSLDNSLAKDNASTSSDTFKRLVLLSKGFERIDVLVPTNLFKKNMTDHEKVSIFTCHGKGKLRFFSLYKQAKELLKKDKYELVVTNDAILGFLALILRKKYNFKLNINVFGSEFYNREWYKQRIFHYILGFLARFAIKRADSIRTDTLKARDLMVKVDKIPKKNITIIPVVPSQDTVDHFLKGKRDEAFRKVFLKDKFNFLILSVTHLEDCKDVPNLLQAIHECVQKYPKMKLLIVGDGERREETKKMIIELNLKENVELLGSLEYQKLPHIYASSDLFVISSMNEGLPRVLMEAGYTNLPVVTTDIDGAADIIENKISGMIVPIRDSHKLAEAIIFMYNHPKERKSFAEAMHRKTLIYCDFEDSIKNIKCLWNNICSN